MGALLREEGVLSSETAVDIIEGDQLGDVPIDGDPTSEEEWKKGAAMTDRPGARLMPLLPAPSMPPAAAAGWGCGGPHMTAVPLTRRSTDTVCVILTASPGARGARRSTLPPPPPPTYTPLLLIPGRALAVPPPSPPLPPLTEPDRRLKVLSSLPPVVPSVLPSTAAAASAKDAGVDADTMAAVVVATAAAPSKQWESAAAAAAVESAAATAAAAAVVAALVGVISTTDASPAAVDASEQVARLPVAVCRLVTSPPSGAAYTIVEEEEEAEDEDDGDVAGRDDDSLKLPRRASR